MRSYMRVALAVLLCFGTGIIGSLFIDASVGSWYDSLRKPFFTPPDWVFLPVWTLLYGMMAASLSIMWIEDGAADDFRGWVPLFISHLLANLGWVIFFFGFHAILIAFIDILVLAFTILMLLLGAREVSKLASYLLVPYFAWVMFALVLNMSIWIMN